MYLVADERGIGTARVRSRKIVANQIKSRNGFSLPELLIVLSIALVAAAMAVMSMQNAARSIRLAEAATDYGNLLQKARIRAVQDDTYYTVLTTISTTGPRFAYVDIAKTATLATSDPQMVFEQGVVPVSSAGAPALSNLKAAFLPPGANALATINTTTAGPTFSPRGLPCTPASGAGGVTTCTSTTPTSYMTFVQNTQNGQWGAITVTPAGRIREWIYDSSVGNWLPRN